MSDKRSDETKVDSSQVETVCAATVRSASPEKTHREDSSASVDASGAATSRFRRRLAGLQWLGKTLMHGGIVVAAFVGGIALIGVAQRTGWIRSADADQSTFAKNSASSSTSDQRYICPMMCTPPTSEPGRCPVCAMKLVPATSGGRGDGISVTIAPAARRLIGIQTTTAKLGPVEQTIRTVGSIEFDEGKLATISAYVSGRIEKLYANYVGVPVGKDDALALVYSPDLYSAQIEYLTAAQIGGLKRLGGSAKFSELAKQKLIELGLTESQVSDLRRSGTAESRTRLKSPIKGIVIDKFAVEGDYITMGQKIYRIADLSTLWLMLDLFPDDAARVRFGQHVEAEVNSMPGEIFAGRVAFIAPTVDATTKTVRVRVEMPNPDGKLKPGDFATARVKVSAIGQDRIYDPALAGKFISPMHPQVIREQPGVCPICGMNLIPTSQLGYVQQPIPGHRVVTVPRDAVLMTGQHSVIYVETEPARFEIRRVTLGPMTEKRAVVLEGINAGETVATSGNFLVDSQMQLAGNPSLMDPSRAPTYSPGPLELPQNDPMRLAGEAAIQFDRAYQAYFAIQETLAADQTPPRIALNTLKDALGRLLERDDVPPSAQVHLQVAKRFAERMDGSLEQARHGFRPLSHSLLKTATVARGETTARKLVHMFCPMVPGGGGDWMQPDGELLNPYWGSEMLSCGETVRDMAMTRTTESEVR